MKCDFCGAEVFEGWIPVGESPVCECGRVLSGDTMKLETPKRYKATIKIKVKKVQLSMSAKAANELRELLVFRLDHSILSDEQKELVEAFSGAVIESCI